MTLTRQPTKKLRTVISDSRTSGAQQVAPPVTTSPVTYELRDVGLTVSSDEGTLEILRGVTFDLGLGEIIGVVGRSGAGKTTLLRILGGLLAPTSGEVCLDGHVLNGPPRTAVTVFQDYGNALLPWRTVRRNVGLPLERKVPKKELRERVNAALEMVGLHDRGNAYPWQLSGGMQQRVQIARALVLRPRVLLMDEPFGALDAMTKAALQDELLGVQHETGSTILFITHDIEEAIYLSDRVVVLAGPPGQVALDTKIDLPRPRNQVTSRESPSYIEARHRLYNALNMQSVHDLNMQAG